MIYCVIPPELEEELLPRMVEYYRDNPNVEVIVDRRARAGDPGGGNDRAGAGVAERAGDPAHRARVVALVEQLEARLDGVARVVRQRLGRERLGDAALARPAQEALQPARASARRLHLQRHADRALADPPERVGLVDAQLADPGLGPLRALVRDESLTQEERPPADGTGRFDVVPADIA